MVQLRALLYSLRRHRGNQKRKQHHDHSPQKVLNAFVREATSVIEAFDQLRKSGACCVEDLLQPMRDLGRYEQRRIENLTDVKLVVMNIHNSVLLSCL